MTINLATLQIRIAGAINANELSACIFTGTKTFNIHQVLLDNQNEITNILAADARLGNILPADRGLLQLAGIPGILPADLMTIINHPNTNAAVLNAVVANATSNAASDTAVLGHGLVAGLNAASLTLLATRTAITGELTQIANHVNAAAAVLIAVATNAAADAAVLTAVATNAAADAAVLNAVVAHAAADAAVLTAAATNAAADAAVLDVVVANAASNAASDTAVLGSGAVAGLSTASLTLLATRTLNAAEFNQIADHANANDPNVINAILGNAALVGGLDAARLAVLAARTANAVEFNQIADHANANDPNVINAILGNAALVGGLDAARLAVLATRVTAFGMVLTHAQAMILNPAAPVAPPAAPVVPPAETPLQRIERELGELMAARAEPARIIEKLGEQPVLISQLSPRNQCDLATYAVKTDNFEIAKQITDTTAKRLMYAEVYGNL